MKRRQTTVDGFFKTKRLCTYFYIDWRNLYTNMTPKLQCLYDPPSHLDFFEDVLWRDLNFKVTICGHIDNNDIPLQNPLITSDFSRIKEANKSKLLAVLVSQLQKCVRRGLTEKCIRTALCLIFTDINVFMRRLTIIMLEDTSPHASLPALIWLMSAVSKGFQINHNILAWLLGVVQYMCCEEKSVFRLQYSAAFSKLRDIAEIKTPNEIYKKLNNIDSSDSDSNSGMSEELRVVIVSLLFRHGYGGMTGDKTMIMAYIHFLLNSTGHGFSECSTQSQINTEQTTRDLISLVETKKKSNDSDEDDDDCVIVTKEEYEQYSVIKQPCSSLSTQQTPTSCSSYISHHPVTAVDAHSVKALDRSDLELFAVDFHCYPTITQHVVHKFPQFNEQQVKSAMWHLSSKLNYRVQENKWTLTAESECDTDDNAQCWSVIKEYAASLQRAYILSIFNS